MARKKEKCHRQIVGGGRIKEKSESSKHHWDKNKPVYPEWWRKNNAVSRCSRIRKKLIIQAEAEEMACIIKMW